MDFQKLMNELKDRQTELRKDIEVLSSMMESAKVFTANFLSKCSDVGYDRVSIGKKHPSVESTKHYPFGAAGSVFAGNSGGADVRVNGSPAIWRIVERMGISGGCGNGHQHQVNDARLIDGVYHFRDGSWYRVEDLDD